VGNITSFKSLIEPEPKEAIWKNLVNPKGFRCIPARWQFICSCAPFPHFPLSPAASGRGQLFKNTHTIGGFLGIFQMVRGGFLP